MASYLLPFVFIPLLIAGWKTFSRGIDCGGYLLPVGIAITMMGSLALCLWVLTFA